jgi:uncharacterized protein YuzE
MEISIQTDIDSGRVLAVYLKIREGQVSQTVEVDEDACFADEDSKGNLIGVEMIAPGSLEVPVKKIARRYKVKGMTQALRRAKEVMAS